MEQSGTRHRRTQTASIHRHSSRPIEIVVTSPGSESFPLSPPPFPTRTNLVPPTGRNYELLGQEEEERGTGSRRGSDRIKWAILILLALLTITELGGYGKKIVEEYNEKGRILREEEESRRNLVRREIASKLFPNTTFYPSSLPPTSQSASSSATHLTTEGYLFPIRIVEQESKAQQHLHQLALLAISLNRTLILPNVGGSRLHSCHSFPFSFHYDINSWLERFDGKLSVIEQEDWVQGLGRAEGRYSVRSLRLMEGKRIQTNHLEESKDEGRLQLDLSEFCLDGSSNSFDTSNPSISTLYAPFLYREFDDLALGGFSNGLVTTLSRFAFPASSLLGTSMSSTSDSIPFGNPVIPADVLFVDYDLRYPIFPSFLPNSTDLTPFPSIGDLNTTDVASSDFRADTEEEGKEEDDVLDPITVAQYDPFPALRLLESASPLNESFLPFRPMPYSKIWTDVASSIARQISPYAATHWRMESVPPSHLSSCAASLARTLNSLFDDPNPPQTVYLASDYSFDAILTPVNSSSNREGSGLAHSLSDTFTHLTSSHRNAATRLVHLLRPSRSIFSYFFSPSSRTLSHSPSLVTLTNLLSPSSTSFSSLLSKHLSQALEPLGGDLFQLDSGLKGILDKLVLIDSDRFVAGWGEKGSEEMCGKKSSFTESVIVERTRRKLDSTRGEETRTSGAKEEKAEVGGSEEGDRDEAQEVDKDIVTWFKRPA